MLDSRRYSTISQDLLATATSRGVCWTYCASEKQGKESFSDIVESVDIKATIFEQESDGSSVEPLASEMEWSETFLGRSVREGKEGRETE
jgi:hypothetical protein